MTHGHSSVMAKQLSLFSPLSLTPALWFDASDAATITSSSGKVSQWNDKSGNARHAVQATSALQPSTGSQTQNGLNVLSFSLNLLRAPYTLNFNNVTVTAVALKSSVGAGTQTYSRICAAWNTSNNAISPGDYGSTNSCVFIAYPQASYGGFNPASICYRNGALITSRGYTYNTASVSTFAMNGGGVTYRHNGSETTGTTSTTTMNSNEILLGNNALTTGGDSALNGWIAEIVIVPRTLNSSEISLLEGYLKTKWATV